MKKQRLPLKIAIMLSILAAISIILGKYLAIPGGEVLRFSFENLPIIFSGMAFGPIAGALTGAVADLVGCVLVGYAINPVVTLGAVVIGAVSGLVWMILSRTGLPRSVKIAISVSLAHLVGSVVIKTFGLAVFYSMPVGILMLWRLLNYVIVGVLEGVILYILLGNRLMVREIKLMMGAFNTKKETSGENKMTYDEALAYIHGVNHTFCKPGLERISELCTALGNPQDNMNFIHVAGTNGKGSTASMLSHLLRKAGYKVGLYTSPYIYRFNERIQINNEEIIDAELISLVEKIKPLADRMSDKPTEFELITAMAFEYFRLKKCDVVVLEVGMGGRFDSTNIIRSPKLSIITGISLDHVAFLGDTVEKIAFEKAGIIKDSSPVLYGGTDKAALEVIKRVADERGSALYTVEHSEIKNAKMSLSGGVFDYKDLQNVHISLLGAYQFNNAALVLDAVKILCKGGMEISEEAVRSGISEAKWRARFEILSSEPCVIFDGAHNAEGIGAAVESIEKYFPSGKICVLTGVLSDKDYMDIAKNISRVAKAVYTITPDNPRALPAHNYADVFRSYGTLAYPCQSIDEAIHKGVKYARDNNVPLFCLGSLYTYSSVVDALDKIL